MRRCARLTRPLVPSAYADGTDPWPRKRRAMPASKQTSFWIFLAISAHKAAEHSLNRDPGRVNFDRFDGCVRRPKLNLVAKTEESLQRRARLIDQGHDDFTIARLVATLNQRNVAVADMLIDHRVAFDPQRIHAFGSHSSQKKARHTNRLNVLHRVDGHTGGDSSDQANSAHRIS